MSSPDQSSADAALAGTIAAFYEADFGRDPTAAELAYWADAIGSGAADTSVLRDALFSAGEGRAHLAATVASLYETYLGRDPTTGEAGYWADAQGSGRVAPAQALAIFASQPDAATHEAAAVANLYDTYMGRDPTTAETGYWTQALSSGAATGSELRQILLADAGGEAHTADALDGFYQTFLGRDPTAAEADYWTGAVRAGLDLDQVRAAILSDPGAQAHVGAEIGTLYDAYFGRDPTAQEVTVWKGLIAGGADFDTLREALATDPGGPGQTAAEVDQLYLSYFGRDPTAQESVYWVEHLVEGTTPGDLADVLATVAGDTQVDHLAGSGAGDTFVFSATIGHVVITGFEPDEAQVLMLGLGTFDPLAHAEQTTGPDGEPDVLITYDQNDTLLFKALTLADLHASDFLAP